MSADIIPMPSNTPEQLPRTIAERRRSASFFAGQPVPERAWLVPDLIPAGEVTLIAADGGSGKSLLALQLADAVSMGRTWLGRPVARGTVEFLSAEDSLDELHRRQVDIVRMHGGTLAERVELNLTSLSDTDATLATPDDGREGALVATSLYDELDAIMHGSWPTLLVLDTLADVFNGNENKRSHARQFVGLLRQLAKIHDCTIVILFHPSANGMSTGTGTSGSTGWSNSVRSRLYLDRVRDPDGREADPNLRLLRTMKSNYARAGGEIFMRYERGAFATIDVPAADPLLTAAKAEAVFMALLAKYDSQGRPASLSTGSNYAPKLFEPEAREQGINKRALIAAMSRLLDAGRIEQVPYGPPSRGTKRLISVVQTPS
jgi:RecA-family ATPase